MDANETEGNPASDTVSIDSARDTLGDLVLLAGMKNRRFTITRHGRPTAALVSIEDLDKLRALDAA